MSAIASIGSSGGRLNLKAAIQPTKHTKWECLAANEFVTSRVQMLGLSALFPFVYFVFSVGPSALFKLNPPSAAVSLPALPSTR